eukprot:TRINITY_DN9630_c0_g1_i4.p1 TRINITY_DN9630_c0_g1~~TRINITY_DN9630_c0_g1_i4.p1  ORF type:complete len:175 (+),score=1.16 TRINITY_DN9630_c0_g1_i4:207-731(+)
MKPAAQKKQKHSTFNLPLKLNPEDTIEELLSIFAFILDLPLWQPVLTRRKRCWKVFFFYSPLVVTFGLIIFTLTAYGTVSFNTKVDIDLSLGGIEVRGHVLLRAAMDQRRGEKQGADTRRRLRRRYASPVRSPNNLHSPSGLLRSRERPEGGWVGKRRIGIYQRSRKRRKGRGR